MGLSVLTVYTLLYIGRHKTASVGGRSANSELLLVIGFIIDDFVSVDTVNRAVYYRLLRILSMSPLYSFFQRESYL